MQQFGVEDGTLSRVKERRLREVAKRYGCVLRVSVGNSGHCTCGHGCTHGECPRKQWWFETENNHCLTDGTVTKVYAAIEQLNVVDRAVARLEAGDHPQKGRYKAKKR